MELEKLSGNYNRGYTRAIQDVIEVFKYVNPDLLHHKKRMNYTLAIQLLETILKKCMSIRDGYDGFIRFNGQKNCFEWFIREKQPKQVANTKT